MVDRIPTHARIVIIGGGAIGCSIAYHFGKLGIRDVVLLEKGKLTAGSTWHAAGLLGQMRSKVNLTRLMQYSARLCATIGEETGQDVGWRQTGSLRLAGSNARLLELKRAVTAARSYGFDMELIGPEEVRRLYPLVDASGLEGATWIASDGYVDPYALTMAYAKGARTGGVRIVEGVTVTGLTRVGRRISAVETDHGTIACETVVNAAGLWARHIGEMAGLELPVTVLEHQYLVTEKSAKVPDGLPSLRDPDNNFYVKPEPGALAIGGWEPNTVAVGDLGKLAMTFGQELFGANHDRLSIIAEPAAKRIPVLNELGIRTVINGPIPISADGEPVMGRAGTLDNLFIACGFTSGIAASGGAGKALAEWIAHGDPGMDLWAFDLRRFGRPHGSLTYLRDAAIEAYSKYYTIAWPEEERSACRPLRRSPLHATLAAKGAVYGSKFGFERPNYFLRKGEKGPPLETFDRAPYADVVGREHRIIREGVGLVDMTSFSKFELSGPAALSRLQYIAAANVDRPVGSVIYTQLLNERGGIEADLTIMRTAPDRFYIVTGSGFGVHDGEWIARHLPADGTVQMTDVSSAYAVMNLAGPRSREVLAAAGECDVSGGALPYMNCRMIRIGYAPVLAARVTYVGELGYELHVPTEYALHVYETLMDRGAFAGIADVGYKAISSLRMEKRYLYWSADITPDYSPLEAGLGFAVAFNKGDFLGRAALIAQKAKGLERRLHCFALDEPLPVYGGEAMLIDGRPIGMTTSGDFGHTVGKSLVLGYVPKEHFGCEIIEVEAFGKRTQARRVAGCAYDPAGAKVRG